MATVMEFLHTATLVHDDIIDNADTRRNRPTINAEYGNQTAVLMGDWLYMSAFETSLAERSLPILDILTAVTRKMTEGELLQLTLLGRTDISEEQYLDVLRRKTAFLFSACCEVGALLGGATETQRLALRDYGLNLGTAFQLIDDLLDFTGSDDRLGKACGVDLLEGKVDAAADLPARDASESARDLIQTVIRERSYTSLFRGRACRSSEPVGRFGPSPRRGRIVMPRLLAQLDYCLIRNCDSLRSIPTYVLIATTACAQLTGNDYRALANGS